jgi:hypothetical protein
MSRDITPRAITTLGRIPVQYSNFYNTEIIQFFGTKHELKSNRFREISTGVSAPTRGCMSTSRTWYIRSSTSARLSTCGSQAVPSIYNLGFQTGCHLRYCFVN